MKLKKLVKKGGVADIVTLMIIVGLVVALIIAVVIPMINDSSKSGAATSQDMSNIQSATDGLAGRGTAALNALQGSPVPSGD